MPRLLNDWIQIHPGLQRVQAHTAQATANAGDNSTLGRAWDPTHDIDIEALDARLGASPPASLEEFIAHVCALITVETGLHCDAQTPPPRPVIEQTPEPSTDGTVTA